ncbi:alpha/beta hydrolase [uncultured Parvimonas sp.]|uniref:alpha/beta hydrolase n=1 Tax=uncultured Parvimonas sp. TaxID=747372 RepID=UPI0028D08E38|nr:alpha/beta hydrolase [uncultured Parvimonas sp.]
MKNVVIYIHGKGGNSKEVEYYKKFFNDEYKIIGFDYKSEFPRDAKIEFSIFFDTITRNYDDIYLIANSLGAYYSMLSLSDKKIKKAMFISPIVDMEKLILNMMNLTNVSEEELYNKKEIATSFGETLSWEYLSYVRDNPLVWDVPTDILYAENDNITSLETMTDFVDKTNSRLTIMKNGVHYFHTEEQMNFLDNWFKKYIFE